MCGKVTFFDFIIVCRGRVVRVHERSHVRISHGQDWTAGNILPVHPAVNVYLNIIVKEQVKGGKRI